jgi:cystathionine beta-lyase
MFVADMDFRAPEPLLKALHKRIDHGIFGYEGENAEHDQIICERMARLYNWKISPEDIIYLPGLVTGLNLVCRAIGEPQDNVLVLPPVYPPFLSAPTNQGLSVAKAELKAVPVNQSVLRYEIDFDAMEKAITPLTKLLMFCQPHNPVGREFTRNELEKVAAICAKHDILICSDEIHCDLVLGDIKHTPTASISAETADRCITLIAPSKTFNIAGLNSGIAIVQNAELKRKIRKARAGLVPSINCIGLFALKILYAECTEWIEELRHYLLRNREIFADYVMKNMPGIKTTIPEATYLAWLDCREAGIAGNAHEFFLNKAKVAVNDGATFGPGGEGFVRFNFGCPQSQMLQALEQMKTALAKRAD